MLVYSLEGKAWVKSNVSVSYVGCEIKHLKFCDGWLMPLQHVRPGSKPSHKQDDIMFVNCTFGIGKFRNSVLVVHNIDVTLDESQ